jgi:hypothetical protein
VTTPLPADDDADAPTHEATSAQGRQKQKAAYQRRYRERLKSEGKAQRRDAKTKPGAALAADTLAAQIFYDRDSPAWHAAWLAVYTARRERRRTHDQSSRRRADDADQPGSTENQQG